MKKIKQFFTENKFGKEILSISIIILISTASFMLGRLTKEAKSSGIVIECPNEENAVKSDLNDNPGQIFDRKGEYFASVKGKKYYPVACSAGKTIKLENRKYFKTEQDAKNAGYELSSSCK